MSTNKAIVVQSKGKGATGVVTEKSNVQLATTGELDAVISSGLQDVVDIFSGKVADPLAEDELKRCSSCAKKGRQPFHKVGQFSLLQNGKRLSQCKVCRTEQAVKWEKSKGETRKQYHKEYQKIRKPAVRVSKALKEFVNAMTEQETGIDAKQALFVAMPQEDVETT